MGYTTQRVEDFGGLNLVDDPGEVGWSGAIDLLNVDFDKRGRVRTRSGWTPLASGSQPGTPGGTIFSQTNIGGARIFFTFTASGVKKVRKADQDGGTTSDFTVGSTDGRFAALGTGTDAIVFMTDGVNGLTQYVEGTGWSVAVAGRTEGLIATTPWDNRLVLAGNYRVRFSDPGAPTTFGTNNWIDLDPGDGDIIKSVVTWRDFLFVCKSRTLYVFYGTSTDASGNPIFNYRAVRGGIGGDSAVATPDGVYLMNARGIYVTQGSVPTLVSEAVNDYLLHSGDYPYFASGPVQSDSQLVVGEMSYAAGRLFYTVSDGVNNSSVSKLVYDIRGDWWSYWDVAAIRGGAVQRDNGDETLYFWDLSTSTLGYFDHAATDDNGTAITSLYRSGFLQAPPGKRADGKRVIRQWRLRGSGTADFGVAADDASAIPTTGGGAKSSIDLAGPYPNYRTSQIGNDFSWQVSASSGSWRLDSAEADFTGAVE